MGVSSCLVQLRASPALHRWRGLALPRVKAMAFHILGDERGAAIKAIRTLPASAAVLAMRWLERGIERVRIEVDGRSYAPDIHLLERERELFKRSSRRRLRELSNAGSRELNDCAAPCPADETANYG